jgi:hypothetical protein
MHTKSNRPPSRRLRFDVSNRNEQTESSWSQSGQTPAVCIVEPFETSSPVRLTGQQGGAIDLHSQQGDQWSKRALLHRNREPT